MKYKVTIEETISDDFEVEANSLSEAKQKAISDYKDGKIVLESGELQQSKIMVVSNDYNEKTDWEEI